MKATSKLARKDPPRVDARRKERETPSARVVYTQAPLQLALVLGRDGDGWRVRVGDKERVVAADPAVDPALLDEAIAIGARALLDASAGDVLVGVLSTRRALSIDPKGEVVARVERISITAAQEALIKTPGSFLQLKGQEVEIYGTRIVTRAREVAKILARMINLN